MTAADVRDFIALAREHGLRRLKVDGLEFEFGDAPVKPGERPRGRAMPSGEDFLFWSTGEPLSVDESPKTIADRAAAAEAMPGRA